MKKFFERVYEIITHLCFAMTMGLAVLCYLEGRNPLMKFLNSNISRAYIWITCALSIIVCLVQIARFCRRGK